MAAAKQGLVLFMAAM